MCSSDLVIKGKEKLYYFNKVPGTHWMFAIEMDRATEEAGHLPVAGALEIVPELLSNHAKGRLKLVSRDLHPPKAKWDAETPANMLEPVGLPNVDIKWNRHCVLGTTGSELLDGLPPVLDSKLNESSASNGNRRCQ